MSQPHAPRRLAATICLVLPLAATHAGAQITPAPASPPVPPAQSVPAAPLAPAPDARKEAALEAAVRAQPDQPGPVVALASFWAENNQVAKAVQVMNQGIHAMPRSSELRLALARLLLLKGSDYDTIEAYEVAIRTNPRSMVARLELGDFYRLHQNDPDKALGQYEEVLAIQPRNVDALTRRAEALAALHRFDAAVTGFRDALAANAAQAGMTQPGGVAAMRARAMSLQLMLAETLQNAGKPAEAMAMIDAVLKDAPSSVEAHIARGDLLRVTGKADDARREYTFALIENSNAAPAHVGLGLLDQAAGQTDQAMQELHAALQADRNNVEALNALAWISAERKQDLDEALRWASRAASLAPHRPEVLDTLGWVLRQRGDAAHAEAVLTRASAMTPSAVTLTHLGLAQEDGGHRDAARKSFEAALKLAPEDAAAKAGLSRLD